MGQHPVVLAAMHEAIDATGRRRRRHAQHLRHHALSRRARTRACGAARQGCRAAVHLGLCLQRRDSCHARKDTPRAGHLLRRAQPRLDDRGHQAWRDGEASLPPQRPPAPGSAAGGGRSRGAETDRLRVGLFDGRRFREDRRILRPGREIRRLDLSGRGTRRRPLRPARRRRGGARRRDGPRRHHRGHACQGLRRDGRLYRGLFGAGRLHPLLRAGFHLHDPRWRPRSPPASSPASAT